MISEHSALKKLMLQGISGTLQCNIKNQLTAMKTLVCKENSYFFLVGWDLRHQVLRPLLAYCTAPDDR
jgi:hypothetical protein